MKTMLFAVIVLGTALQFYEAETSKMACTVPNCPTGCTMDANHQPCPACVCDDPATRNKRAFPFGSSLSMKSCNRPDCRLTSHWSFPKCECNNDRNKRQIACSMPKCDEPGCSIDYSTLPCPSCQCNNDRSKRQIACTMPECDEPGCSIDYSTSPCPSCQCSNEENARRRRRAERVQCSKPRCKRGCFVDYTASPCPRCKCNDGRSIKHYTVSCSTPICEPGCAIDLSTIPCPSCKCNDRPHAKPGLVKCPPPPPKCDPPYTINWTPAGCPEVDCRPEYN